MCSLKEAFKMQFHEMFMPRKEFQVLLILKVSLTIMHNNVRIRATPVKFSYRL